MVCSSMRGPEGPAQTVTLGLQLDLVSQLTGHQEQHTACCVGMQEGLATGAFRSGTLRGPASGGMNAEQLGLPCVAPLLLAEVHIHCDKVLQLT